MPTGGAARPRSKSTLFDVPAPGGGLGGLLPRTPPAPKTSPADPADQATKPGAPAAGDPPDKKA